MTIKDHIKGNASFVYFRDGSLWYRTGETQLLFPVPVNDTGTSTFLATEKGVFFMRWIRKYLASLDA
jgi:hypothetical protein